MCFVLDMQPSATRWIELLGFKKSWNLHWRLSVQWWKCCTIAQRSASFISKWPFQLFRLHYGLFMRKYSKPNLCNDCSNWKLGPLCALVLNMLLFIKYRWPFFFLIVDLFTHAHDLARLKIFEAFSAVCDVDVGVVHMHEPHFGLQTSLVGRTCRRFDWMHCCLACCKFWNCKCFFLGNKIFGIVKWILKKMWFSLENGRYLEKSRRNSFWKCEFWMNSWKHDSKLKISILTEYQNKLT